MIGIKKAEKSELTGLVSVYKKAFRTHNIFKDNDTDILNYLSELFEQENAEFFIALANDEVVGGIVLIKEDQSESLVRYRLKHFAVKEIFKGVGSELLKAVESAIIHNLSETQAAKIEIHVVDNEGFYKKFGYKEEGCLENHYRLDEKTILLGKTLRWKK